MHSVLSTTQEHRLLDFPWWPLLAAFALILALRVTLRMDKVAGLAEALLKQYYGLDDQSPITISTQYFG